MTKAYNLFVKILEKKWNIPCANYESIEKEIKKIANNLVEASYINKEDISIILNDLTSNVSVKIKENNFKSVNYSSKLSNEIIFRVNISDISSNYI